MWPGNEASVTGMRLVGRGMRLVWPGNEASGPRNEASVAKE